MTAIVVVTPVASKKEVRRMAYELVERGLAACAQAEKIDSVDAWKGKIETGRECRVARGLRDFDVADLDGNMLFSGTETPKS